MASSSAAAELVRLRERRAKLSAYQDEVERALREAREEQAEASET